VGVADSRTGTDNGRPVLQNMTIGDVLAHQARIRLAEKGFEVLSPSAVKVATKDRVPTSPQMAVQILREANLDAAGLYIEVRRWEPTRRIPFRQYFHEKVHAKRAEPAFAPRVP
jgi:hypothetical protein